MKETYWTRSLRAVMAVTKVLISKVLWLARSSAYGVEDEIAAGGCAFKHD